MKEEDAKVLAVYYTYNVNTFRKSEKLRSDLARISFQYGFRDGKSDDEEFNRLFDGFCEQLERNGRGNPPRWAKLIMAEKYSLNV